MRSAADWACSAPMEFLEQCVRLRQSLEHIDPVGRMGKVIFAVEAGTRAARVKDRERRECSGSGFSPVSDSDQTNAIFCLKHAIYCLNCFIFHSIRYIAKPTAFGIG